MGSSSTINSNANTDVKHYGVASPISTLGPRPDELEKTKELAHRSKPMEMAATEGEQIQFSGHTLDKAIKAKVHLENYYSNLIAQHIERKTRHEKLEETMKEEGLSEEQTVSRNNQVLQLLNSKMRVILCDNRTFIGKFVAYDKHMNLVLTDCVEYHKYKPARTKNVIEAKKNYGVVILRGENVMSVIVESSDNFLFLDSSEHSLIKIVGFFTLQYAAPEVFKQNSWGTVCS